MRTNTLHTTIALKANNKWGICVISTNILVFLKGLVKIPERHPQAGFCKDWNFTEQAVGFYVPFEQHCLQLLNSFSISMLKKELEYCF